MIYHLIFFFAKIYLIHSKLFINTCPCGLSKYEFDKELRVRNLRYHKVQILSKLKHQQRRSKRSFLEANYTIILEKVPYQAKEVSGRTGDGDNVEEFIDYDVYPEEYDDDEPVDFGQYDYYEAMNFLKPDLNTMKLDLTQVKSEDLKNEAPWIGLINGLCNAVFVNRQFILSSKKCIETLNDGKEDLKFHRNCNDKKPKRLRRKIDFFQDFALLKLSSKKDISLKNYPICLPKASSQSRFARVFAVTTSTQENCRILDTFVKLEDHAQNCSNKTKKTNEICGMSPDQRDCQWVAQQSGSFVTRSSSQSKIQLLGIASGFSSCRQNTNSSKIHFTFHSISQRALKWIAKKIRSGECPELYDD